MREKNNLYYSIGSYPVQIPCGSPHRKNWIVGRIVIEIAQPLPFATFPQIPCGSPHRKRWKVSSSQ